MHSVLQQLCRNAVLFDRLEVHSMRMLAPSAVAFDLYAQRQSVMASAILGIMQQLLPGVHASRHFMILFCSGCDLWRSAGGY